MCRPVRRAGRTGRPLQTGQGREGCGVVADAAGRVAIECGIARVHVEKTGDGMNRMRVEDEPRARGGVGAGARAGRRRVDNGVPARLDSGEPRRKGPACLLDEIKRDEATDYVQPELELGLLAYFGRSLLRLGVRGASVREIVRLLRNADPEHEPVVLKPNCLQVTNRVDLWYKACTSRPQRRWQKRLWRRGARMFAGATGIEALPLLSLAVAKRRREGQSGSNKPL